MNLNKLDKNPVFQGLDEEITKYLSSISKSKTIRRRTIFHEKGDTLSNLIIIKTGFIVVNDKSTDGKEAINELLTKDDIIGSEAIFEPSYTSSEIKTITTCDIETIPLETIREAILKYPELGLLIGKILSNQLIQSKRRISETKFLDVSQRTARQLESLSKGQYEFSLPITQDHLASLVGASRERVNKAIRSFIKAGWIVKIEKKYKITNRPELKKHGGHKRF